MNRLKTVEFILVGLMVISAVLNFLSDAPAVVISICLFAFLGSIYVFGNLLLWFVKRTEKARSIACAEKAEAAKSDSA
jgi:hypothetical protein